jgi:DNA processing protein
MDEREKLARIRLIQTRHIGPMTFSLLIQRYGSALAALAAIPDLAARGGRKLSIASLADAKAELAANDDAGARLIWRDSDSYPLRLAQFDDAPVTLSTRGNLHLLHKPMIALVGARNASINAIRHAETLARELGEAGYVIVSGMARGIDAAAHRGAMATGTVGVIGVVVIEAAAKSGSLITAREAGERGSEVMAIPGSPLDPRSNGCNQLIRDGATLVQNAADIIEAVGQNRTVEVPPKKTIWVEMPQTTFSDEDILKCREIIISGLGGESVDVDDLIAWCDQPSAVVWAAILELELAGQLTRHYGNRVSRQFEF